MSTSWHLAIQVLHKCLIMNHFRLSCSQIKSPNAERAELLPYNHVVQSKFMHYDARNRAHDEQVMTDL